MNPLKHTFDFVVDSAHDGLRIDTFLVARLRNYSAAQMQRLAAAGLVAVNDLAAVPDQRVHRGDSVRLRLAEPSQPFYEAQQFPLEVVYDDPWITAINKPAGVLLHPVGPVGDGTVANMLQGFADRQSRLPGLIRPGIVHRLDRETSGVVVVAKDYESHRSLTQQFERAVVRKIYVALVAGLFETEEGEINLPIGQQPDSLMMSVGSEAVAPRSAKTKFRVRRRFRSASLLELYPGTGRKHQLRVHLGAIGHPILGDRLYASSTSGTLAEEEVLQSANWKGRHSLHAAALSFRHPVTNAPMNLLAPVPPDFWEPLAVAAKSTPGVGEVSGHL